MEKQILETIENAVIERMAKEVGVQAFRMKSMIGRCEELKAYYKEVRNQVIKDLAEKYLVCNKCKGDTVGACSQADGQKGFDIYCFDCESPSNKTLVYVLKEAATGSCG